MHDALRPVMALIAVLAAWNTFLLWKHIRGDGAEALANAHFHHGTTIRDFRALLIGSGLLFAGFATYTIGGLTGAHGVLLSADFLIVCALLMPVVVFWLWRRRF